MSKSAVAIIVSLCAVIIALVILLVVVITGGQIMPTQPDTTTPSQEIIPTEPDPRVFDYSLFSWNWESTTPEERDELVSTMNKHDIGTLYQWLSSSATDEQYTEFTDFMTEQELEVYALIGDPSWAKSKNLDYMIDTIDRAATIGGIQGIVIDVEPYVLDEYDEDNRDLMEQFAENMNTAYLHAKELGFEVVICIWAHWDDDPVLEEIIRDSCDEVCVMNYYANDEFDTIEQEAIYADQYDKMLINASELQPTGDHDISDKNTYYSLGIPAMQEAWAYLADQLATEHDIWNIEFSYHNYEYLKEFSMEED